MLSALKDALHSVLGVSPDAIMVLVGLGCFLVTCLVAGRPLYWPWALLPGLCISMFIEIFEIWQHYGARRLVDMQTSGMVTVLLRHARDILVMNIGPLLVVVTASLLGHTNDS